MVQEKICIYNIGKRHDKVNTAKMLTTGELVKCIKVVLVIFLQVVKYEKKKNEGRIKEFLDV